MAAFLVHHEEDWQLFKLICKMLFFFPNEMLSLPVENLYKLGNTDFIKRQNTACQEGYVTSQRDKKLSVTVSFFS